MLAIRQAAVYQFSYFIEFVSPDDSITIMLIIAISSSCRIDIFISESFYYTTMIIRLQ